ncbi:MAG: HlyD family type I secretion periplasmic adaptor subunit [Beijerinckiaceae bacterium]
MSEKQQSSEHKQSIRKSLIAGISVVGLFGGTIGLWAATSPLAGAVVASGQFVVDSNVKKIQHQQGGVVSELPVRDGQRVKAGDLLIHLDETITKANLQIVVKQLDDLLSRLGRLEAERDARDEITVPAALTARAELPDVAKSLDAERRMMEVRRSQRDGQKSQLRKRVEQLKEEIGGIQAQTTSRNRQMEFIEQELVGVRDLYKRNLVPITRVMPLEREAANMLGQRGQLMAGKAQAEGKIAEIELQLLQIDIDLQTEVSKELREIQAKTAELMERKIAAEDQLKRVEIRSPIDGYVHQLAVHTVGGVISPAEPAMLIVPFNEDLQIEARVQPTDVDQLFIGQKAVIKVLAGNQRVTPEIAGKVSRISADVTREQQTGLVYYTVRITTAENERAKLGDLKIISGMQAESFIQTTERTPFDFMIKPLKDQFNRAFRER